MIDPARSLNWLDFRRFALVLFLLILASFPAVIFGLETFIFRDFGFFGYPLAHFHRESIWNGELPLWNPHNNLGIPFLAQWNTLVLYPGSLIYLLFPLQWSLAIFSLVHLFVGGLGMYRLAHRWTWSALASSIAGLAYAFNGLTLNCLMWPNNIAALGLMPWVVLWVERGFRDGGRAWFIAALVGACQMLSGAPEIILFTWLFLTVLLFGQSFQERSVRFFLRFTGLVALIAGLSAAQLLPVAELLKHSHRNLNYSTGDWSMPPWGWANLIHPIFYCFKSLPGVYFQPSQFWTSSYYPGIIVVALAFLCWRAEKRRVYLLLAVLLTSLVLALGSEGKLYPLLESIFPQIRFARFPIKFVVLAIFIFPVLAAYGARSICQPLLERENNPGSPEATAPVRFFTRFSWPFASVLLLLLLLTMTSYVSPRPSDDPTPLWVNPLARGLYLALAVIIFWLLLEVTRPKSRVILQVALLVVLWLDVWTHSPNQNPTVRPEVYASGWRQKGMDNKPVHGSGRAMISRYAQEKLSTTFMADPYQFYLINRQALYANCNLLDAIPKLNGFYSLYVKYSDDVIGEIYESTNRYTPEILDFLGITYLTESQKVFDWLPRATALPLATIGQAPRILEGTNALTYLASESFDPRREVLLGSNAVIRATADPEAKIVESKYGNQRLDFTVEATRPALLTVAQSWYPGWRAKVDGKIVEIFRANYGFQAVEVPAGRHRVELVYYDRWFRMGAAVSLACLLFAVGGVGWRRN